MCRLSSVSRGSGAGSGTLRRRRSSCCMTFGTVWQAADHSAVRLPIRCPAVPVHGGACSQRCSPTARCAGLVVPLAHADILCGHRGTGAASTCSSLPKTPPSSGG